VPDQTLSLPRRVAILGAGPAGLCLASHLSKLPNVGVDVFEKTNRAGGLLRSVEHEGLHFDIGTYLFIHNHGLLETFPFLRPGFVPIQYRPQSLTPALTLDAYPFTLRRFLKDNGLLKTGLGIADLLLCKVRDRNYQTVPGFARYFIGNTIYRKSGLQRYIFRLHNLPDEEIDLIFAESRLKALRAQSFRNQLKRRWHRLTNRGTGKPLTSLQDRSVRPADGLEAMFGRIVNHLTETGVGIQFETTVSSVRRCDQGFIVKLPDGEKYYDRVVSTIPIPVMLKLLGEQPANCVTTRSLLSLFYRGKMRPDSGVLFNFSREGRWKRITVFSKFYGPVEGDDYFTVEITTDDHSEKSVQGLIQGFEGHILKTKLLNGPPRLLGHLVTPNAYPVYQAGQMNAVEQEKQRLTDHGIDYVGRQGNFEYVISHFIANNAAAKANELTPFLLAGSAPPETESAGQA
jgi:protoporphyrinogen oxidase